MVYLLRQLLAVVVLPVTMVVVIPLWIARAFSVHWRWPAAWSEWSIAGAGVPVFAVGLALFAASLWHFATEGRGTLAPWDPPRRLVVRGPYRHVRNPMFAGVIFLLFGTALLLRSVPHGIWALAFSAHVLLQVPYVEEPMLERRFGDEYRAYVKRVPRFLPLVRPHDGNT